MTARNPVFPPTRIDVLDRPRTLLFTNASKIAFEDATGLSSLDPGAVFNEKWSNKTLRALLWAGLRHDDPKLTLEDAGDLLDAYADKLPEIVKAIGEAWTASYPKSRKAEPTQEDLPAPDPIIPDQPKV